MIHDLPISAGDTVRLESNVHVYGGFDGSSNSFSSRDWEANVTTLRGDQLGYPENRVHHVVMGADDSVLDGFHVTNGYAPGGTAATAVGGGMLNVGVSPTVRSCEFSGNYALTLGGAVANAGGEPLFEFVRFVGNGVGVGDADPTRYGGAAANVTSHAVYRACTFEENRASYAGGAVADWMQSTAEPPPFFREDVFANNTAPYGAAMYNFNAPATSSTPLYAPWVFNSLFHGNSSTRQNDFGGTIFNYGANAHPVFVSCTVADNVAGAITGGMQNLESSPVVFNSIFAGNLDPWQTDEISSDASSSPWVGYSDIQSGWTGSGTGNISASPEFAPSDYHLLFSSPCIDAGLDLAATYPALTEFVNHDLDYESRPNGAYDMGCYENGE